MKRFVKPFPATAVVAAFAAAPAPAAKPAQTVSPNEFPSGGHYNLNILEKKDGFAC
jgi:hypothetical protein